MNFLIEKVWFKKRNLMSKCSKMFSKEFFAVSLSTISTLRTWATERGQTDRQWKFWHKQSKKEPIPSLPAQLRPQPADCAMTLETPAFRYISHQQICFLQRNSQPHLSSEGRTRSPGTSSESVTEVLCSYLSQRILQWVMCEVCMIVCCVEVTHSTLELSTYLSTYATRL